MRFLNSMPARIRAVVALVVVLAGVSLVARFDDGQERRFESYDAMRAEGQGSYTWFPVFLPASARQIVLYTRVDTNYFHAGFSLDAKAMADFDVHLKTGASAEGLRLLREQQRGIGRAWCARAQSQGGGPDTLYLIGKDDAVDGRYFMVGLASAPAGADAPAMKQAAGRYCESEPGA